MTNQQKQLLSRLKSLYLSVANAGGWKYTPRSVGQGEWEPTITVDEDKFIQMRTSSISREQDISTHQFLVEIVNHFPELLEILGE